MKKITSKNFEFLRSSSGKNGNKYSSISVDELERFVKIMNRINKCMKWKVKEEQKNATKVVGVLERAINDARNEDCDQNDLPFEL